jgi:hypothetical protein
MLDEMPVKEISPKPSKFESLIGLTILAGLAGVFLYFLYQSLTNQIKF